MLDTKTLHLLKDTKNLLAFSAGVDSSALFFLLLKHKIPFDIAIVNYNTRKQSLDELAYANELAKIHKLKCFSYSCEKIEKNFESKAREIRYNFFENLIQEHKYKNLLTAHHLGDRFEWMLMQFCKGAGCAEIAGMKVIESRDSYNIVRPLLQLDKQELLHYLQDNNLKYFEDESNLDEDIKRNEFRHNYSMPLLNKYLSGIKKSFDYIDSDREILIQEVQVQTIDSLGYFKNTDNMRTNIFTIDKYLKSQNYMLSAKERELLKGNKTVVVGRKFVINQDNRYIFIANFIQNTPMTKEFKELCRALKIEPKLRPYLYQNSKSFLKLKELLGSV